MSSSFTRKSCCFWKSECEVKLNSGHHHKGWSVYFLPLAITSVARGLQDKKLNSNLQNPGPQWNHWSLHSEQVSFCMLSRICQKDVLQYASLSSSTHWRSYFKDHLGFFQRLTHFKPSKVSENQLKELLYIVITIFWIFEFTVQKKLLQLSSGQWFQELLNKVQHCLNGAVP